MKITKEYLRRVIKEELERTLSEGPEQHMTGAEIIKVFQSAIDAGNTKGVTDYFSDLQNALSGGKTFPFIAINDPIKRAVDIVSVSEYEKAGREGNRDYGVTFSIPYSTANILANYGLKIS